MRCVVGIDLGSTTTKAVLLDEAGEVLGRGITNSRSDYEVACAVAREEALLETRFHLLERALAGEPAGEGDVAALLAELREALRLELYLGELAALQEEILALLAEPGVADRRRLENAVDEILAQAAAEAPALFQPGVPRRSDFFRDLAGAAYATHAEALTARGPVRFERLLTLWDRAILAVERRVQPRPFAALMARAQARVVAARNGSGLPAATLEALARAAAAASEPIDEAAFVGTGYGRQTLPFAKEAIRSEILCHGRGAHAAYPLTRTVLDIGGQDTKAIQVDDQGVVRTFQMNDRCAAGCGRFLGYLADELNLGLHELGPLALSARRATRVSSTCTVFAGAELRERLALGEKREDVLAGLHRAMMLRAISLLARSGGVADQLTFTGGVCRNGMAVKVLRELVAESWGAEITVNVHPASIYVGALGAALFARDNLRAGRALAPQRVETVATGAAAAAPLAAEGAA